MDKYASLVGKILTSTYYTSGFTSGNEQTKELAKDPAIGTLTTPNAKEIRARSIVGFNAGSVNTDQTRYEVLTNKIKSLINARRMQ